MYLRWYCHCYHCVLCPAQALVVTVVIMNDHVDVAECFPSRDAHCGRLSGGNGTMNRYDGDCVARDKMNVIEMCAAPTRSQHLWGKVRRNIATIAGMEKRQLRIDTCCHIISQLRSQQRAMLCCLVVLACVIIGIAGFQWS